MALVLRDVHAACGGQDLHVFANRDDITLRLSDFSDDTLAAFGCLAERLLRHGHLYISDTSIGLPPQGHGPTAVEVDLLREVGIRVADTGCVELVGIPIESDSFVEEVSLYKVSEVGDHALSKMHSKYVAESQLDTWCNVRVPEID